MSCPKCNKKKCCCPKVISKLGYRGKAGGKGSSGKAGPQGPPGPTGPPGPSGAGANWNNQYIPDPGNGNGTDIYNGGVGNKILISPALPAGTNLFWFGTFFIESIDTSRFSIEQVINNAVDSAEHFEDDLGAPIAGKCRRTVTMCGFGAYSGNPKFEVLLKAFSPGGGSIKVRTVQVSFFTL